MFIAASTVSILVALVPLASGVMKVRRAPGVVTNVATVGGPARVVPGLGALKIAATLGLLVGRQPHGFRVVEARWSAGDHQDCHAAPVSRTPSPIGDDAPP